jgi:hypothetical protein
MRFPRSRRATVILALVFALAIGGGTAATMAFGGIGGGDVDTVYVDGDDRYDDDDRDAYDDCDGYRDEDDDC